MGVLDMVRKSGGFDRRRKEFQEKKSDAIKAIALVGSGPWKWIDREFFQKELKVARRRAQTLSGDDEERIKAQGVVEFIEKRDAWLEEKAAGVDSEELERLTRIG